MPDGPIRREYRLSGAGKYVALVAIGVLALAALGLPFALAHSSANPGSEVSPADSVASSSGESTADSYSGQPSAVNSPAAVATSVTSGPIHVGGGSGWGAATVTFSPTMRSDRPGWVSISTPPFATYCSYTVSSDTETLFTHPEFHIIPSTVDVEYFSLPSTFLGVAHVDLTCRPAGSSGLAPAHWRGAVTVLPIPTWSLRVEVNDTPIGGQWTMYITASLGATCNFTITFPPNEATGRRLSWSQTLGLGESQTAILSADVLDGTTPGTITYHFACVDWQHASHDQSGSFQALPSSSSPAPTVEPTVGPPVTASPAPTVAPTVAPTTSAMASSSS